MKLRLYENRTILDQALHINKFKVTKNAGNFTFPISTIKYMRIYKSGKEIKSKKTKRALAGVLFFTGIATGLHALMLPNKGS